MVDFSIEVMGVPGIESKVLNKFFDFFSSCFNSLDVVHNMTSNTEEGYIKIESRMDLREEVVNEVLEDFTVDLFEIEGVLSTEFRYEERSEA